MVQRMHDVRLFPPVFLKNIFVVPVWHVVASISLHQIDEIRNVFVHVHRLAEPPQRDDVAIAVVVHELVARRRGALY